MLREPRERLAGLRCAEIVLYEVVGVHFRVGQIAVTELLHEQRIYRVGVDASDLPRRTIGGEDGHETIRVAVELQVVEQPEVLQYVYLRERYGAFPVEVGQQIEEHHFALVDRTLLRRDVDVHRVDHQVAVLLLHYARGYGVVLVDGDGYASRGDVVEHGAVGQGEFGLLVLRGYEVHQLLDLHHAVHALADGQIVVHEGVFAARQREWNGSRLVGAGLHLVDVPLASQVAGVHDPHVGAHAVHLLIEP